MATSDREPLSDPRDYVLDLSSQGKAPPTETPANVPPPPGTAGGRPHLSILFRCCNVYAPIYRTADEKAYAGNCPRCARPVRVKIGPGGSTSRVFIAE